MDVSLDEAVIFHQWSSILWEAFFDVDFRANKVLRAYELLHVWKVFDPLSIC